MLQQKLIIIAHDEIRGCVKIRRNFLCISVRTWNCNNNNDELTLVNFFLQSRVEIN